MPFHMLITQLVNNSTKKKEEKGYIIRLQIARNLKNIIYIFEWLKFPLILWVLLKLDNFQCLLKMRLAFAGKVILIVRQRFN